MDAPAQALEIFRDAVQGARDSPQSVKKAGEVARGVGGVKSVKNSPIAK